MEMVLDLDDLATGREPTVEEDWAVVVFIAMAQTRAAAEEEEI
jgi:hypothetical protein